MTFLNGLLAFGAAAFTIPLVIHLLQRSRYQTIDWGAMHLLHTSRQLNSRRLQWQQILLLLLRCALPVLLAMAMARPLLKSWQSADAQSAMSLAIIIDDSISMFAFDRKDVRDRDDSMVLPTQFSIACQSAADILKELPVGSNCRVILGGSKPDALVGQLPDELDLTLSKMANRTQPAGKFELKESMHSALQWLAGSPHPRRQLVLVSDFQEHEWSSLKREQVSDFATLIATQTVRPEISFLRVGPFSESELTLPVSNLSVDSIVVAPTLLATEREATITTTLANHGSSKCDSVWVAVFVNEVEIDRQEVSLAEKSATQVRSLWIPKQKGDHLIRVQLLRDDNLIADNGLSTAIVVQEPIPILLVDGDRHNEVMKSETDFLRLALSPFSLLEGSKGDVFFSKTIQPNDLNESILANFRTVCICNVSEVTDVQQMWLRNFVEQGNGLIFFLGDRVRIESYQTWPTVANNGLRIASYLSRTKITVSKGVSEARASQSVADQEGVGQVNTQQIEFSPLRELSPESLSSLASVRFLHRTPMTLNSTNSTKDEDVSIALRFEDEQPWILDSSIGRGRCLWINTACDEGDSNLPTRSVFVPLVHKLVAYACNAKPPATNIVSGEVWSRLAITQMPKAEASENAVRITKPDGLEVTAPLTESRGIRFADTRLLGAYVAKPDGLKLSYPAKASVGKGDFTGVIAACSSSEDASKESNFSYLPEEEVTKLASSFQATLFSNSRTLLRATRTDWHGREIWTWIWIALVLCFLAEMALEQNFSPRSKVNRATLTRRVAQGTFT